MNKVRVLAVVAGLVAVLGLAAACSNGEAATVGETPAEPVAGAVATPLLGAPAASGASAASPEASVVGAPVGIAVAPAPAPGAAPAIASSEFGGFGAPSSAPRAVSVQASGSSQAGIWVSGQGTVSLEPDLALLNIGVESTKKTVVEARDEAARAMDAIVEVLSARGIEGRDVQTRFFNISPRYEFREVIEEGFRTNRQVLVGYQVSNTVAIKIRDLDAVGDIIDEVVAVGGDVLRINGISFTVEDPKPFMAQLREDAVNDALAKAEHFASLTKVSLGRLVFISESGAAIPVARVERVFALGAPTADFQSTSISGGELELRMRVQVVFDILP